MQRRHAIPVALAFFFALTASECEDLTTPDPEPSVLQIVSGDGQEAVVGQSLADALVVGVLDQNDVPMEGVAVTWATASGDLVDSGPTDASGRASADWTLGTEAAAVTATASVGSMEVTFDATALPGPVADLAASPDSLTFDALVDTAIVTAAATDEYGNAVSAVAATWVARDTAVATVTAAGVVTAVGNGTTWVVAEADGETDSVKVIVAQVAATVVVTPDSATLVVGDTMPLSATAEDANGHVLTSPSFSWSSSLTDVARVDGAGLVTAVARGTALISAEADGGADTALVVVESDSGTVTNPVCAAGNDTALVGHWSALEFWDGGEDGIARGNRLLVSMAADSAGRILQLVPEEVAPGDTVMATDSAHVEWVGCSGQMTVTLVDQWIESSSGEFGSAEIDYTVSGDTLELVIEADVYGTFESVTTGTLDADLMGDWILIRDLYQSQSNPADTIDTVVEEGLLTQLMAGSDGTLLYSETDSLAERYEDIGVWSVRSDTIIYYSMRDGLLLIPYTKPAADRWVFTFDDASWDFDGDGTDEAAIETGTLARPDTTGLVGTWVATAYVVTNKADTTQSVDRIDDGASLEVAYGADGSYTVDFSDPSGSDLMSGTYEAAGGYVWMIETGEYLTFIEVTISGDTATVTGTDWYDFDDDGEDEEAYMEITLSRQP